MQKSLGLETAEGLKTDETSMFLSKVAFDFLVCSLKKKQNKLSLGSWGWECGVKASACFSAQEKQLIMVELFRVEYIGQAVVPTCFKTLADIR